MTQANKPDVAAMLVSFTSAAALFSALMTLVSFLLSWRITWLLCVFAVGLGAVAAFARLALSREK